MESATSKSSRCRIQVLIYGTACREARRKMDMSAERKKKTGFRVCSHVGVCVCVFGWKYNTAPPISSALRGRFQAPGVRTFNKHKSHTCAPLRVRVHTDAQQGRGRGAHTFAVCIQRLLPQPTVSRRQEERREEEMKRGDGSTVWNPNQLVWMSETIHQGCLCLLSGLCT